MTDKIKPCPSISLPDDMANDLQSFKEAESHRNGHPSPTRARLFEIIDFLLAAHAPKETGIKPDNAEAAVPVSELQHIVDNVSALKDLRIKLQQLIHRYQPAGDDNEKV